MIADKIEACPNCGSFTCDRLECFQRAAAAEFACKVCGAECPIAPIDGSGAVCEEHCEDHDYGYRRRAPRQLLPTLRQSVIRLIIGETMMGDEAWIERRLDAIETELKGARERRKAAERACDVASIYEGDPVYDRACRAYDHADHEVCRLVKERYDLECQLADIHRRQDRSVA